MHTGVQASCADTAEITGGILLAGLSSAPTVARLAQPYRLRRCGRYCLQAPTGRLNRIGQRQWERG